MRFQREGVFAQVVQLDNRQAHHERSFVVTKPRKVVGARADNEGDITHVLLEGNQRHTPVETAMGMADRGELSNAHSVRRNNAKPHLRTNPNDRTGDNLDHMAGDT